MTVTIRLKLRTSLPTYDTTTDRVIPGCTYTAGQPTVSVPPKAGIPNPAGYTAIHLPVDDVEWMGQTA